VRDRLPFVGAGAALAVTGLVLVNATAERASWLHAGWPLVAAGLVVLVLAEIAVRRSAEEGADPRLRDRRRAEAIVSKLIADGDRLHHHPGFVTATESDGWGGLVFTSATDPRARERFVAAVEGRWRTEVGENLSRAPFKKDTADWILNPEGNRLSNQLERLREVRATLDSWLSEPESTVDLSSSTRGSIC
jgi:hypothetical protein